MKILIATPILYDVASPFNHLFRDILQGFTDAGHRVTRIVATEDESDHRYDLGLSGESFTYLPVHRKPAPHGNIIKRYLTDTLTALKMANRIRKTQADVLFEDVCYSSFWTVRAAKKKKMRVVAMLQDIWPDNAVQSGLIGDGGLIYRYFEWWQRYVYQAADQVICISDDMKTFLMSKGVAGEKIEVIHNWGYTDETVCIPWEENALVRKYDLDRDKFYAIYAGNIGRMQNVELVAASAAKLQEHENIRFLIIGGGVREDVIRERVKDLPNVQMLPMQPAELATSIYSAAGVNLIPLVPGGVKTALPSKTGVVLSCGRPAIFAFGRDCSFAKTVRQFHAGDCVDGEDSDMLSSAILKWSREEAENSGAYALFTERFTKTANVAKYVKAITE